MTKDQARKLYLQKRIGLSDIEYKKLSDQLTERFFAAVDLSSVKILHSFLPIEKQKEVNTWLIIDRVMTKFKHVRVSIPRINNQSSIIENFFFEGKDQLTRNTWGIFEPKQGVPTPDAQIDTVLVPLLAVDRQGNRVGYGRGFYDKFLATVNATKIGLSFFAPLKEIEGMSKTDIPVDMIVTPEGSLKVKRGQ